MTSLAFLSFQRVGFRKVPHVPSNTERLQAFRRYQPVQFANDQLPRSRPANSPTPSPGWAAPFNSDPPAWDEVVTDYAARRGE